ncbi:putative hydroxyacylglutathione hydrolase C824.07 [Colletotrichum liriopes]|uniref:hydroxyacylglutathione hydrolase n=1 Tax=Colletotrichum liriopes TaxID=708192 RepID=A0AA37GK12_9PEZI|nr:putative hydroxyacylglutathione hydrolase C824.07 [Colletotrichum liriopes]
MHIQSIPMWVGSSNNYAYLVKDDKTNDAVIIDPANPAEVTPVLQKAIKGGEINLTAVVNTHQRKQAARESLPPSLLTTLDSDETQLGDLGLDKLPIIGGKNCDGVTKTPGHGESFHIGSIAVKALHTPCHTQDSICWFMQDGEQRVVFTGDTLFISGGSIIPPERRSCCGKFFEGNAEEMHNALNKTLASLPDDTAVFRQPGHEYTKSNVKFAASVLQNEAIQKLQAFAENNKETQGKFTIGDEKDPEVQRVTGENEPVSVMAKLREMKNNFKYLSPVTGRPVAVVVVNGNGARSAGAPELTTQSASRVQDLIRSRGARRWGAEGGTQEIPRDGDT